MMRKNGDPIIECDFADLEWRVLSMATSGYAFSGFDTGRVSRPTIPIYNIDRNGRAVRVEMDLERPVRKNDDEGKR